MITKIMLMSFVLAIVLKGYLKVREESEAITI